MSQINVCDNQAVDFERRADAQRPGTLPGFARSAGRVVAVLAAWQRKRRTRQILTKLNDCQLRDIGIDPTAFYGERVGSIDEVHGDRFHGL